MYCGPNFRPKFLGTSKKVPEGHQGLERAAAREEGAEARGADPAGASPPIPDIPCTNVLSTQTFTKTLHHLPSACRWGQAMHPYVYMYRDIS